MPGPRRFFPMLTTALNGLVAVRAGGFRLMHGIAGRDGFGPLLIGLTIVGGFIWVLSKLTGRPATRPVPSGPA
jgi:hypothetical protein